MEVSNVYFTDLRVKNGDNLLTKLQRLIKTAGIGNIDFSDKYGIIADLRNGESSILLRE